jgi:hypothetical protein
VSRVIDQLRREHPGHWRWDADDRAWVHESGRRVRAYAAGIWTINGIDDERFRTELRWEDTQELAVLAFHSPADEEPKP